LNSIGDTVPRTVVQGTDLNDLTFVGGARSAFRVEGTAVAAVPEPTNMLLLWTSLFSVLCLKCWFRGPMARRLVIFRVALGTNEIVYITRAYHVLVGNQVAATYIIGPLRYSINAFQALSLRLFGSGVGGADGLYFVCSLARVLLA
jgi:hypothetical protein